MGQPKKLTFAEKKEKKQVQEAENYRIQIVQLRKALKNCDQETAINLRWAALELFKTMQNGMETSHLSKKYCNTALEIARNAQIIINF
jgi:methylthioribose-1-phosphate isomerase